VRSSTRLNDLAVRDDQRTAPGPVISTEGRGCYAPQMDRSGQLRPARLFAPLAPFELSRAIHRPAARRRQDGPVASAGWSVARW
jgi:hypothetical protein